MDSLKRLVGLPTAADVTDQDKIEVESRECQGRAFLTGLAVWPIVFNCLYFGQRRMGAHLKGYSPRSALASSWLFGLGSGYLVWSAMHTECQKTAGQKREAVRRRQANPAIS